MAISALIEDIREAGMPIIYPLGMAKMGSSLIKMIY